MQVESRCPRAGVTRLRLVLAGSVLFFAGLAAGTLARAPLRAWLGLRGPRASAVAAAEVGELWTCGMHPQVIRDHPGTCPICGMALTPLAGGAARGPGAADAALLVDASVVQNMGLRVAPVAEARLTRTIRAAGVLTEPEPARHDVSLRVGGWIERLHAASEGLRLARGEPLFDLYSPELQVALEELIAVRKLRADPTAGAATQALEEAARRRLELYGLPRAQVEALAALDAAPGAVTFTSPADGYLVEKTVYAGSAVAAGDTVMRIADTTHMWLDARVFEQDLAQVRPGQEARARIDGRPGEELAGRVILVHPRIDPATRTALVRTELDNPALVLRQGMYATVFLEVEIAARALTVPREAIIDTGTRQVAFVALDAGHFEPRQVTLGASGDGGLVQVLAGLASGEQVVVSGQFLLDAESRTREAIQRFLQERAPPVEGRR